MEAVAGVGTATTCMVVVVMVVATCLEVVTVAATGLEVVTVVECGKDLAAAVAVRRHLVPQLSRAAHGPRLALVVHAVDRHSHCMVATRKTEPSHHLHR